MGNTAASPRERTFIPIEEDPIEILGTVLADPRWHGRPL